MSVNKSRRQLFKNLLLPHSVSEDPLFKKYKRKNYRGRRFQSSTSNEVDRQELS